MELVFQKMEQKRKHAGECIDCRGQTELVEFDVRKRMRILRCQKCGLLHLYRKTIFGGWKFLKATR